MTRSQHLFSALADLVLIVHILFVGFVVLGLLVIWVGAYRKWRFVRNLWFRIAHLAAIAVVAAEALAGFICPLTTWENQLRVLAGGGERYAESFLQHWIHQVLFYEFSDTAFTLAYLTFLMLVALSFWRVPVIRLKSIRATHRPVFDMWISTPPSQEADSHSVQENNN